MAVEYQDVLHFRHILEAPEGCAICHEGTETDLSTFDGQPCDNLLSTFFLWCHMIYF